MSAMYDVVTLSVNINRNLREVYDFLSVPENFPKWASGLGKALTPAGAEWMADGPQGPVKVKFTDRNDFGVVDYYVRSNVGAEIYIPMRVIANGPGSSVIFTLFRLPSMSEAEFTADADWVRSDLNSLKELLEP